MPIVFEQPGPFDAGISSSYGAAQAMKDFAPFLSRAYPGAGGGNASGGGGRGGGGFAGMGGGGGGDGGVLPPPVDPVSLYAGQQEVDRYFQDQDRQQVIRDIQSRTVDPSQYDQQIADLQRKQSEASDWQEFGPGGQPGAVSPRPEGYTRSPPDEGGDWGGGGTGEDQNIDQASAQQAEAQAAAATPTAPQPPEFTQADQLQLSRLQASRAEVQAQLRNGAIDQGTARRMIAQLQVPISVLRQQGQAAQVAAMQQEQQQRQHAAAEQTTLENMNDQQRSQWIQRRTVRLPNGGWGYVDRRGDIKPLPQDHLERQQTARDAARDRAEKAEQNERSRFDSALDHIEKDVRSSRTDNARGPFTDDEKKEIDRRMRDRGFHGSNYPEHQETRDALREDQPLTRPDSRPTPRQAGILRTFAEDYQRIRDSLGANPTPTQRAGVQEVTGKLREAEEMYRRYGTVRRMPDSVKRDYQDIHENVQRWLRQPWPGQQQQQPAAPPAVPSRVQEMAGRFPSQFGAGLDELGRRVTGLFGGQ